MSVQNIDNLSEEAIDVFLRAAEILEADPSTLNERRIRDAVSLLKVAIQSAGAPFPRAEALLGMVYISLEDPKNAKKYANAALEHNPLELRAQLVKLDLAIQNLQVMEGSAASLLPTGIGAKYIFAAIFRMARGLFIGGSVASTQVHFRSEVSKAVEIFQEVSSQELHAAEFLFFADRFIAVADILQASNFSGAAQRLYSSVAAVSIDDLVLYEDEENGEELMQAVTEIHQIATGRV